MKIIFDIGHPKDFNIFKNAITMLESRGHEIKIVGRAKENTKRIIREAAFDAEYGFHYKGIMGKIYGLLRNDIWLYSISKEFNPDLFVSLGTPYAAHASFLTRKHHISFTDTEIATFAIKLMLPFTHKVYTSTSFELDFGNVHERFNGYLELAYLHPKYFTPSYDVLDKYGLHGDYIIVRLSNLSAHHDIGAKGFAFSSEDELKQYIMALQNYGRVIIFTEGSNYDWDIVKDNQLDIDTRDFHSILYYSKLYIGEGASMASEAAVIGVPSIYVSNTERGYLNELEKTYGLVFNISDQNIAIRKSLELLSDDSIKLIWSKKREIMLEDKVDVTAFIVETIENFANK
ncbi:DUF354 domain-containing protein [uncultured Methanolobus sp.]|uniref:DUF354 domain-containing protein n=1 Tax=uncultured Methanolobus sp. TaxID=218300 RepID=UPI0029C7B2CE|nr:DUF354 domain-containing protein [uncultured Methanolobus sp.]